MVPQPARDRLSIEELRRLLIPARDAERWDDGELPRALLHLDDQAALARCDVLLGLAVVERRSLEPTGAARAVALREVLVELLPKELDHPCCCALRALAGLAQGTAGRRREQRQEAAGRALGPDRHPVTPRAVRRRVKRDCWPWLLDRLIEQEVGARKVLEADERGQPWVARGWPVAVGEDQPAVLPELPLGMSGPPARVVAGWPAAMGPTLWAPFPGLGEGRVPVTLGGSDAPAGTEAQGAVTSGEVESVLDIAARMGWLGSVNAGDTALDLLDAAAEGIGGRYGAEGPGTLAPEVVRLRRHVQELLQGHQHPRQRLRLYALAGRLSAMLGYMAVGRARYLLARAYCAEAFALATAAEDPDLQAWVRGTESLSAYYEKRYADALELARDGQRFARGGPQTIRLAINGEARALGRLGERSGVDEAVERAYTGVARLPHRAGMGSCISLDPYSEARVAANAATAYLSLGATSKVLDYAARIESPVEESHVDWDRSLVRLDVATALIRQQRPDVEHAADVARAALQESAGNPIEPVRQRAVEFVTQARRWQTRPAVRELTEALHGWNTFTRPVPGSWAP